MLTTRRIELKSIDSAEWRDLVKTSPCSSFFQTYEWISLWWSHFSSFVDELLLLGVYDQNQLVGIGPFALKNGTIEFLTHSPVIDHHTLTDYGDIIAKAGMEKIVWKHLLDFLHEYPYKIGLSHLSSQSLSYAILQEAELSMEVLEVAPLLPLPATWEEYLISLSSHDRHELKRKLSKDGPLELVRGTKESSDREAFLQLMKSKPHFLSDEINDFFTDLLKQESVFLYFLMKQSTPIATALIINFQKRWMAYNSSYDVQFAHLSPGIVMFGKLIELAINEKKVLFDFLRGSESYKHHLGAQDSPLYRVRSPF